MKREVMILSVLMLACVLGVSVQPALAQEPQPVVHAVLFYSPTCGHCQYVITEVLPPLLEKYGSQLEIIGFDVTQKQGQAMFNAALEKLGMERAAVPFLLIDDITLVGSQQIPDEFPQLIESYLATGGVPWPDIPGLQDALISAAPAATAQAPTPAEVQPAAPTPVQGAVGLEPRQVDWRERFAADATGNTIAVVILVGMIAALVWGAVLFRRGQRLSIVEGKPAWIIPAACLLGLVVAGYLAYVEATQVSAVCGPIGDCNAVQQSPYSRLFGFLSIGVLGVIGYVFIGALWALAHFGRGRSAGLAAVELFFIAVLGTLFSIYLTFLEPFVIGATCAWCLTSAMLTTALMLLSAGAAGRALVPTAAPARSSEKPERKARASRAR